jgi:Putative transcriptional repressor regulating G2/M transition
MFLLWIVQVMVVYVIQNSISRVRCIESKVYVVKDTLITDVNKSCRDQGNLKRNQHTHSGERPYTCDSFTEQSGLKRHQHIHSGERPYKCDFCNKSFSVQGSLKVHERIHSGERPYSCDVCNQSFIVQGHLKVH